LHQALDQLGNADLAALWDRLLAAETALQGAIGTAGLRAAVTSTDARKPQSAARGGPTHRRRHQRYRSPVILGKPEGESQGVMLGYSVPERTAKDG